MCGIAGIITANGTKPDERVLDALSKALVHRGGDGVGRYVSNGVGFIQTRLAIIDVEGGKQPFFDGENVLVANGEIYNYLELKKELADVSFSTHSDCEIPLHLYRKQGLEFIEKLRGMYAIAIHDHESSRVILALQLPVQQKSVSDAVTILEHTSSSEHTFPLRASQSGSAATTGTDVNSQVCCIFAFTLDLSPIVKE